MSNTAFHPTRAETEVVPERAEGRQLQYHTQWLETHPYQRDDAGVVQLTHDRQLLAKVFVTVEEDIFGVLLPEYFDGYWLTVIAASEHLQGHNNMYRDGKMHSSF